MGKIPLLLGLGLSLFLPLVSRAQYTGPQKGQKVAFLGDSITNYGFHKPAGYVHLVASALGQEGYPIEIIPAGVGGNTSRDMLARVDNDVIAKKPDWMTLSCGVNDVWHGANGVPLDEYEKNITEIVAKAQAAGIKVVILTSTMITEDPAAFTNKKLTAYNDFLRSLAQEKGLPVADLNVAMQAAVAQEKTKWPDVKGPLLTVDGVHMNPLGDQMMASAMLKTWGVTNAQIKQASETWSHLDTGLQIGVTPTLDVEQYLQLRTLAASQGKTVDLLVSDAVNKDLKELLNSPAPGPAAPGILTNAPPAQP